MITTKKRAWVIRWEDITASPIQRKVIAIMDSRISGETMKWFVETVLYDSNQHSSRNGALR